MSTAVPRDIEAAREIERAVLDYYEGWFEADGDRMERALHRDLVKRKAGETLTILTAERMIELTRQGEGRAEAGEVVITIDDVHEDIASVTVLGGPYYEYLHLVRTDEGWKIANALWQSR
jgi:Putative lumazine-binding